MNAQPIDAVLINEFGYDQTSDRVSYPRPYVIDRSNTADPQVAEDLAWIEKYKKIEVGTKSTDYTSYSGIDEAMAIAMAKNSENVTANELIIRYPTNMLLQIHADMNNVKVGDIFPSDIQLKDNQVDLIRGVHQLYYNYDSLFAINNSGTGTGKTVMAIAQALMSGCRYYIIIAPHGAEFNWIQAVRILPSIRDDLYRLTGIWYPWPLDIQIVGTEQVRGDAGQGKSLIYTSGNTPSSVVLMHKIKDSPGGPGYQLTGNQYPVYVNQNGVLTSDYQLTTPNEGAPFNQFYQYDVNNPNLVTSRSMIEISSFVAVDEWHGAKNERVTSHALGKLGYEVLMSRGGMSGFIEPADHLGLIGGRDPRQVVPNGIHIPYGGVPYGSLNRPWDLPGASGLTGRSRILLLSATTTDQEDRSPMARVMGLYAGSASASSTLNIFRSNIKFMIAVIKNAFITQQNRPPKANPTNAMEIEIVPPLPNLLRPEIAVPYETDNSQAQLNINGISLEILSDPFFVRAINYEGEYIMTMTDLILPLSNIQQEGYMKDLVQSASKQIGGTDSEEVVVKKTKKDKKEPSGTTGTVSLMMIEYMTVLEEVRDVIRLLKSDSNYRVIMSFRFNKSIAYAMNLFLHDLESQVILNQLGIVAPVMITGSTKDGARKYVAALFNNNLKYRLLIANQDVIKESNSYHDVHGGRKTFLYVQIPNNAVSYHQLAGRILRIGTKSDSEFKVVSPGLRYAFAFGEIPAVMALLENSPLVMITNLNQRPTLVNDMIIDFIIRIHNVMKTHGYTIDDIHVKLAYQLDDNITRVFFNLLMTELPEQVANLVYQRYITAIASYQVSLADLLHRRDEKSDRLRMVTSKNREIPQSDGYNEKGAIVASFINPRVLDNLKRVADMEKAVRQ